MPKALTKDHFILNVITYFELKKITKIIKNPKFKKTRRFVKECV